MEGKVSKLPKLHGGHSMETGPGRQKPHDFQQRGNYAPKGSLVTGPSRSGQSLNKKYDGNLSRSVPAQDAAPRVKGEDKQGKGKAPQTGKFGK